MKELTIEQKAQRYDEAIERAKEWFKPEEPDSYTCIVESIFPELKESEDDQHRKWILEYLYDGLRKSDEQFKDQFKCAIAWLEKQGEHTRFIKAIQIGDLVTKNEDGVLINLSQLKRVAKPSEQNQGEQKPRFRIGDWVVRNGETLQISGIDTVLDGTFHYWFTKGTWLSSKKMGNAMLWTIQDAKGGDVLATKAGGIFIYKELLYVKAYAYCGVDKFGVFKDCNYGDGLDWTPYTSDVTPTTKEQRDLLFQKMKEAGYTFDFEKKELKKIEQTPVIEMKTPEESLGVDSDTYNKIVDECVYGEQKPSWGEEDTEHLNSICATLKEKANERPFDMPSYYDKQIDWLKSLKDRVQPQPKQ